MPILKNVTLFWVNVDPARPNHYQNDKKNPGMWNIQLRTSDKKVADSWKKEYAFKVTPDQDDDGNIFFKTSLSTYAYDQDGNLNKPVGLIASNGTALDPTEIGNGSVGNVSFTFNPEKKTRRLKGLQVTKLKKFIPANKDDEFELSDDFEIVEPDVSNDEDF